MNARTVRPVATGILLLLAAAAGAGEPATAAALATAHAARLRAMVDGDLPALRERLAEDLTYVHSTGRIDTRDSLLAALEGGGLRYLAIDDRQEAPPRLYGDGTVGVITGTARFRVRAGGAEHRPTLRYTAVYVQRDGRWQLAAWHSCQAPGDPPAAPPG